MTVRGTTATGQDIWNALQKRLLAQGHNLSEPELLSLMIDVMNIINADAANVVAHAASEIGANPPRKFQRGV